MRINRIRLFTQYSFLLVFVISIFYFESVYAIESEKIDSVHKELQTASSESERLSLLLLLAEEYNGLEQDSVVQFLNQAEQLLDLAKNSKDLQLYHLLKGQAEINAGKDKEAAETLELAHNLALENNEWDYLLRIKFQLLKAYKGFSQEKAVEQGIDALQFEEENPDPINKPKIYNTLAGAYWNLGQMEKAVEHYETALDLFGVNRDSSSQVLVLGNLAGIYSSKKNNEKALKAYFDALALAERVSDKRVVSSLNRDICLTYMFLNKIDSSEYYIQRAIDISKEVDIPDLEMENTIMKCLIFSRANKCDQALPILEDLLERAKELENLRWQQNITHVMTDCHMKNEDFKEASEVFKERLRIHKKVYQERISDAVSEATVKYETEKKEAEIERLAMQEQLKNAQIDRQKLGLVATILGLGILTFFMIRLRQKNAEIDKQNKEKDTLLREIHHRVKNNLQVISALLTLQSKHLKDSKAKIALQEGQDRVQSMALIHKDLYQHDNLKGVNTKEYLEQLSNNLVQSYKLVDDVELSLDIEEINLDVDTMIPLGLMVNELISNSLKHGLQKTNNGKLGISLREQDNKLILKISDNGSGTTEKSIDSSKSFGYSLIESFARKLDAQIHFNHDNGFEVELQIGNYQKIS